MKNTVLPSKKRYAKPKLITYGRLSEIGASAPKGMFFSETGGADQSGTMA
jgi:hypothetical protein